MKTKLAWHVHHDVLVEPLIGTIEDRAKYIRENKPASEIELRLKLLKKVIGKLPRPFMETCEKYEEAREKSVEAWEKYKEACETREKSVEACEKYKEAWENREETWEKYEEAREKYKAEIEKLHKKECPDCPWNGITIFP